MTLRTKLKTMGGNHPQYPKNTLLLETSTAGTYNFKVRKGRLELVFVGAGGSGSGTVASYSGGGGAGGGALVKRKIYIPYPMELTVNVGVPGAPGGYASSGHDGGDVIFQYKNIVIAKAGGGKGSPSCTVGGAGGTYTQNSSSDWLGNDESKNGNNGVGGNIFSNGPGATSVYLGWGNGSSGGAGYGSSAPGGNGYAKIIFLSQYRS